MYTRFLITVLLLSASLLASNSIAMDTSTSSTQPKNKVYTFGVVPQQSAKKLASLWGPILQHVSKESGVALRFATAKDIPTFEKRLARGDYDFSYMNPYHYTVFSQAPTEYRAFAKRRQQDIRGIVVVHKDSPIKTLGELNGLMLAFPSPAAFAASILPRAKMQLDGIDFDSRYVSSHDSVYLGVAKGFFSAGGGVKRTFNNAAPEVREQLRVLWTTDAYTPHAFAHHPRVPSNVAKAVQNAFVAMKESTKGNVLLKSIKIKNGIEVAGDKQWDDVRALNIKEISSASDNTE